MPIFTRTQAELPREDRLAFGCVFLAQVVGCALCCVGFLRGHLIVAGIGFCLQIYSEFQMSEWLNPDFPNPSVLLQEGIAESHAMNLWVLQRLFGPRQPADYFYPPVQRRKFDFSSELPIRALKLIALTILMLSSVTALVSLFVQIHGWIGAAASIGFFVIMTAISFELFVTSAKSKS